MGNPDGDYNRAKVEVVEALRELEESGKFRLLQWDGNWDKSSCISAQIDCKDVY